MTHSLCVKKGTTPISIRKHYPWLGESGNHMYLFGQIFTVATDHEPLISIFNPEKGIPARTVACLQRYALFPAGFKYSIEYKNTTQHGIAMKRKQQGSS